MLKAEIDDLNANLQLLAARILTTRKSVEVTRASISRVKSALDIQRERLEAAETLINRGIASRANYLNAFQAFTGLQKERDVLLRELDQKLAQTEAIEAERGTLLTALTNKNQQRRSEIDGRLTALRQQERATVRRVGARARPLIDESIVM